MNKKVIQAHNFIFLSSFNDFYICLICFMAQGENTKVTAACESHRKTGLSRMQVSTFYKPNSETGLVPELPLGHINANLVI